MKTRLTYPPTYGFTLIELMVTIAISAILLGLAAPSFSSFIRSQAVRTASSDITTMLVLARSEAIKRNNNVLITQASGGWQNGWTVTVTTGGNTETLGNQAAFSRLSIAGPGGDLIYGGDGRLSNATPPSFQITGGDSVRCVKVSLSGMPSSQTGSCG